MSETAASDFPIYFEAHNRPKADISEIKWTFDMKLVHGNNNDVIVL